MQIGQVVLILEEALLEYWVLHISRGQLHFLVIKEATNGFKIEFEVEYRSMASTTVELVWITFLFRDIRIKLHESPQLFCDNKSALYMTINPVFHARTKHIEIDYHFVREKVAIGALTTQYIPSSHQIADIFTKPLSKLSFCRF